MSDGTKIEWTDATWNVINGCSLASPGCAHCYAMTLAATRLKNHPSRAGLARMHNGHAQWTGEVRLNDGVLLDPLHWRRPRKIFVCAHGDLFHEKVPDEWIDRVFAVMAMAPQHQFQILTKRPDRMRAYLTDHSTRRCDARGVALIALWEAMEAPVDDRILEGPWPLPNVWLGTSVEDQVRANERIPHLLDTPAAVRWLSAEPLLGPIDLRAIEFATQWGPGVIDALDHEDGPGIDWVVAGGESGPGARPMHPDWARSLRDQCAAAGVPFLFKQWGAWTPGENVERQSGWVSGAHWFDEAWLFEDQDLAATDGHIDDEPELYRVGKKAAGRKLDGVQHDGYPA